MPDSSKVGMESYRHRYGAGTHGRNGGRRKLGWLTTGRTLFADDSYGHTTFYLPQLPFRGSEVEEASMV